MQQVFSGQLSTISYKDKHIEIVVLDPDAYGENKPSIGLSLGMTEKYVGIPKQTLSGWIDKTAGHPKTLAVRGFEGVREVQAYTLFTPSKMAISVYEVEDERGNTQVVIEASDWTELAGEVAENPHRVKEATRKEAIRFLRWYAAKGLYSSAYAQLFGVYTAEDDDALTARLNQLEAENQMLREAYSALAAEQAYLEHRHNQLLYEADELRTIAQWREKIAQ